MFVCFIDRSCLLIDYKSYTLLYGICFGLRVITNTQITMKRLILAVVFGVASLSSISTKAQVNLSINIGSQPQWGPTGYDHVDYYYLPDVDAYYYVPTSQYVYQNNGSWIWRNSLPSRYGNYNLYNGYKVVMNQPKPYLSHQSHIQQYGKYKNYKGKQSSIRDSRETKYVNARNGRINTPQNNSRLGNYQSINRSNNNKFNTKQKIDNGRSRVNNSRASNSQSRGK